SVARRHGTSRPVARQRLALPAVGTSRSNPREWAASRRVSGAGLNLLLDPFSPGRLQRGVNIPGCKSGAMLLAEPNHQQDEFVPVQISAQPALQHRVIEDKAAESLKFAFREERRSHLLPS